MEGGRLTRTLRAGARGCRPRGSGMSRRKGAVPTLARGRARRRPRSHRRRHQKKDIPAQRRAGSWIAARPVARLSRWVMGDSRRCAAGLRPFIWSTRLRLRCLIED